LIFYEAFDRYHSFEMMMKNLNLLDKTFRRMLKNAPAFAPQGGASRRQADAS
jgi:hypothetical protein